MQSLLKGIVCDSLYPQIIPTPIMKGYRNRTKYKIFGNHDGFEVKGTEPRQGEIPYEKSLWMLPGWGKKLVQQVIGVIKDSIRDYWIDSVEVQLSHGNRHGHITLSVKRVDTRSYAELAEILLERVPSLQGVSIPSKKQAFGKSYLLHHVDGLDFYSEYSAFFQSNLCLTSRLVEEVKCGCRDVGFHNVLDLYCGVGLFSLSLADKTTTVVGVDLNKRAIDSARVNAKSLLFSRASFFCSPVENFQQSARLDPNDLIVIDPPRTGCPESLIARISEQKPGHICSVSCYLPTHVRDLQLWIENGYNVRTMAAFDMFPFTKFLETVVFLSRNR